MSQIIELTTMDRKRPVFVMAGKIVSFMPASNDPGTLVFLEGGVSHHVANHAEDVKLLIELSIGEE